MTHAATVTSKRQITIPSKLYVKLGWKKGQKVVITEKNGMLTISSALALIDKLAGSVKVPERFKGLTPDEMVEQAIEERFGKP